MNTVEVVSWDKFKGCVMSLSSSSALTMSIVGDFIESNANMVDSIEKRMISLADSSLRELGQPTDLTSYFYRLAKYVSRDCARFEQFNEHLSEVAGFKVLIDHWTDSAIAFATEYRSVNITEHLKNFYIKVNKIPIEITDSKKFTVTALSL